MAPSPRYANSWPQRRPILIDPSPRSFKLAVAPLVSAADSTRGGAWRPSHQRLADSFAEPATEAPQLPARYPASQQGPTAGCPLCDRPHSNFSPTRESSWRCPSGSGEVSWHDTACGLDTVADWKSDVNPAPATMARHRDQIRDYRDCARAARSLYRRPPATRPRFTVGAVRGTRRNALASA
jgi:hypothetical protein